MATLDTNATGELRLTLRGMSEDRILTTVRHWPHWRLGAIEPDPGSGSHCLTVTLVTDRTHESTVREILKRSFGLTFPPEGGSSELAPEPPPTSKRRGGAARSR